MFFRLALFVFSAAFLSCSIPQGVTVGEEVKIKEGYGLAVMSLSRSGFDVPYQLYYKRVGNKNILDTTRIDVLDEDDWFNIPVSEEGEIGGRLFVIQLPVGNYKFHDVTIEHGYLQADWGGSGPYSFDFQIVSGVATYIGNFHFHSSNVANNEMEIKSLTTVSNKFNRDLPLFRNKYESLKSIEFNVNLADSGKDKAYERLHLGVEESILK